MIKLPSQAFAQQIAELKDENRYTGVLLLHCHEGTPLRMDAQVSSVPVFVLKDRRATVPSETAEAHYRRTQVGRAGDSALPVPRR